MKSPDRNPLFLRGRAAACLALAAGLLTIGLTTGLLTAATPAAADMYVWKDPKDGRTRMTNIPPPWLREPPPRQRIPKVEVIREQKIIDAATALSNPQEPAKPSARQLGAANPVPKPPAAVKPEPEEEEAEEGK